MGRPFYPHEADDPDLDWIVSNFLYEKPNYIPVEAGSQPLMLIPYRGEATEEIADESTAMDRKAVVPSEAKPNTPITNRGE